MGNSRYPKEMKEAIVAKEIKNDSRTIMETIRIIRRI